MDFDSVRGSLLRCERPFPETGEGSSGASNRNLKLPSLSSKKKKTHAPVTVSLSEKPSWKVISNFKTCLSNTNKDYHKRYRIKIVVLLVMGGHSALI